MSGKVFHISVNGPEGTTFPSFPSSELTTGDPAKTILKAIRAKCVISNKLFFTVDGKSPISDNVTLSYYMSMTKEGSLIIRGLKEIPSDRNNLELDGSKKSDDSLKKIPNRDLITTKSTDEPKNDKVGGEKSQESDTRTFTIQVAGSGQPPTDPMLSLSNKDSLVKLADRLGKDKLELGQLPGFKDRELASLKGNYAALADGKNYIHPSDMRESDWNRVLMNNRALYGYNYSILAPAATKKAKKQAFRIRVPIFETRGVRQPDAKSDKEKTSNAGIGADGELDEAYGAFENSLPPIPPFYVFDDATVDVTEVRTQEMQTLTKLGFKGRAIEFSLAGKAKGVAASVEASYQQENSQSSQSQQHSDVQSIIVSFKFPRVVVELDEECLELTDECRRDAMKVRSKDDVARFYRDYGNVFVTSFALGGCLQSTRLISASEKDQLDEIKNSTRRAAGFSIQSPAFSVGLNYTDTSSDTTKTGSASLQQDARLTWDARGGDTVLCSNPPAWASTVKDFNLWRLLDQQQIVRIEDLIRTVDSIANYRLEHPAGQAEVDGNVTTNAKLDREVRLMVMRMINDGTQSVLKQQMEKYYEDNKFESQASVDKYNEFMKKSYPDEEVLLINKPCKFVDLAPNQVVGLGLYMAVQGSLKTT